MISRYKLLFRNILLLMTTNFAFANVTVSIGEVSVEGYTEEIVVPVIVTNMEQAIGGFQFDVIAVPSVVSLSGVSPIDSENFSADFNILNDGSGRIVFYSNSVDGLPVGNDVITLNLHYNGGDILSALVDLEAYNLTVSDSEVVF